jgi:hypothetical protein
VCRMIVRKVRNLQDDRRKLAQMFAHVSAGRYPECGGGAPLREPQLGSPAVRDERGNGGLAGQLESSPAQWAHILARRQTKALVRWAVAITVEISP